MLIQPKAMPWGQGLMFLVALKGQLNCPFRALFLFVAYYPMQRIGLK